MVTLLVEALLSKGRLRWRIKNPKHWNNSMVLIKENGTYGHFCWPYYLVLFMSVGAVSRFSYHPSQIGR